jgi:hypothetical protein
MFYDVLQCMSRAVCEHVYGLERLKEKKMMAYALKQSEKEGSANQIKKNIQQVFTRDYELEFTDVVTGMPELDHQIESVDILRKSVNKINKKPQGKLCMAVEGEEIYTSKHYVYGCLIVDCWREYLKVEEAFKKQQAERHAAGLEVEPFPSLQKS